MNWSQLKVKIGSGKNNVASKPSIDVNNESTVNPVPKLDSRNFSSSLQKQPTRKVSKLSKTSIAMDCEMVGIGIDGKVSALARCSVVDFEGNVLYDEFVQPKGFVTDFRTRWSGVRKGDIRRDKAVTIEECQNAIAALLKGRLLVGHALQNDLTALLLSHPRKLIRDTSKYPFYMRKLRSGKLRPRALRELTKEYLGVTIQEGEHDSVEDARCAMKLYRLQVNEWEDSLVQNKSKGAIKSTETSSSVSNKKRNLENNNKGMGNSEDESRKRAKKFKNS